jgi:hypothetical protein
MVEMMLLFNVPIYTPGAGIGLMIRNRGELPAESVCYYHRLRKAFVAKKIVWLKDWGGLLPDKMSGFSCGLQEVTFSIQAFLLSLVVVSEIRRFKRMTSGS